MKYIVPLLTILLLPPLYGQQIFGLSYNISIPQGETRDFIENTSYTGFGIEGRQFITNTWGMLPIPAGEIRLMNEGVLKQFVPAFK